MYNFKISPSKLSLRLWVGFRSVLFGPLTPLPLRGKLNFFHWVKTANLKLDCHFVDADEVAGEASQPVVHLIIKA